MKINKWGIKKLAVGMVLAGQTVFAQSYDLKGPVEVHCRARNFVLDATYADGKMDYTLSNTSGKRTGHVGPFAMPPVSSIGAKASYQSTYDGRASWISMGGITHKKVQVEGQTKLVCQPTRTRNECAEKYVPAHEESQIAEWVELVIDVKPHGIFHFNHIELWNYSISHKDVGLIQCDVQGI